jgi:hypothetical protein
MTDDWAAMEREMRAPSPNITAKLDRRMGALLKSPGGSDVDR